MMVVGLPSSIQYQTEVSGLDIGGPCISAADCAPLHHKQSIRLTLFAQYTRTHGERRPPPRWIRSVSGVRTDPESGSGWLPTFNADFLVRRYINYKIFMKIRSVFTENEPNCGMPHLAMLRNFSLKNPRFESRGGCLLKFKQFVFVDIYICREIFTKIQSLVFTLSC